MKTKIPIANAGYIRVLAEIGSILERIQNMADNEVEEIFTHYVENVTTNNDEAAAILTLAEVIKRQSGAPGAKGGSSPTVEDDVPSP